MLIAANAAADDADGIGRPVEARRPAWRLRACVCICRKPSTPDVWNRRICLKRNIAPA